MENTTRRWGAGGRWGQKAEFENISMYGAVKQAMLSEGSVFCKRRRGLILAQRERERERLGQGQ